MSYGLSSVGFPKIKEPAEGAGVNGFDAHMPHPALLINPNRKFACGKAVEKLASLWPDFCDQRMNAGPANLMRYGWSTILKKLQSFLVRLCD